MRLEFEGWARKHGQKIMFAEKLTSEMIKEQDHFKKNELRIEIKPFAKKNRNLAKIYFSTDMRLGGDQLGTITLSAADLAMLLNACLNPEEED